MKLHEFVDLDKHTAEPLVAMRIVFDLLNRRGQYTTVEYPPGKFEAFGRDVQVGTYRRPRGYDREGTMEILTVASPGATPEKMYSRALSRMLQVQDRERVQMREADEFHDRVAVNEALKEFVRTPSSWMKV